MLKSLSDIHAFVRVAQTLNFTKAAEDLFVTPTAISKAIARLENELDAQLFVRTTRSVRLTEAGEVFLRFCTAAIGEIDAGLEALEVLKDQSVGAVRLSASPILGNRLAAALPALMARHPQLDLQLTLTDAFVDLADDRVDIAIRIGDANLGPHYAVPLAQLHWVTVASPPYLLSMGRPTSLAQLEGHACHHFVNLAGSLVPWRFVRDGELVELTPGGGAAINQGALFVDIAVADGGIVQVFDFMVAEQLRSGALVRLLPDFEAEGPTVYALMLRGRQAAPKIKATVQHLTQLFSRL